MNHMGKNVLIVAIIGFGGYLLGIQSAKKRGKNYEDLRHQLERLWTSPDARRSRRRMAKKTSKAIDKAVSNAKKRVEKLTS